MSNNLEEEMIIIQPNSIPVEGIKEILYQMENCVCKLDNNDIQGTGFFCKLPYNKELLPVLITCNHVLNEDAIAENKLIKLYINNKIRRILIDDVRKKYTNKELDITIIEIRPDKDEIYDDKDRNNFMEIDEEEINKNKLNLELYYKNKSIYTINYGDKKMSFSCGILNKLEDRKTFKLYCDLTNDASGCPILSSKTFKIIGIIYGRSTIKQTNYGRFIKYIADEYVKENHININELELIYKVSKRSLKNIFGINFVKNNSDKIELIINGEKNYLTENYILQKGENKIKLIIKNKIENLEYMFYECHSLVNIDGLKFLDVKDITNLSFMFEGCTSLSNITPLENWNVSNVSDFKNMFYNCYSLSNISPLKNWNVSNGIYFDNMFNQCGSLTDLTPLENWNLPIGRFFSFMFCGCELLNDITPLKNWNVSNVCDFSFMFFGCKNLSNITSLINWDVSDGISFNNMFDGCRALRDISSLKNWNVSNGEDFRNMFRSCYKLSDIKPLQKWNV